MNQLPLGLIKDPQNTSLVSKLQQLQDYDFTPVRQVAVARMGWSEDELNENDLAARRFLALRYLDPKYVHAANPGADEFWHHMVLNTIWYREFCKAVFGVFIEHVPTVDPDPGALQRSRALHVHWYGEDKMFLAASCGSSHVTPIDPSMTPAEETMYAEEDDDD